ncbi:Rid family hydrolase [Acinetobacter sp. ANC 3882]|uniref:RidA family protein n=1 Tax=Acinetobacter sp. ANC 3882 TaxID=2923423 RepID=UPI001F4A26DE|nr:Rid family hydrolase [Acinetobacter sp. ANC 3882]MCH7316003.1 RidA family protein [Acinetobacter sp. ANC 3882]
MNRINTTLFEIINPAELYDPRPNGYSHIAVVPPNLRTIHIAGQGGENKNGELSEYFDQQVQQVFYNIQHALTSVHAQITDIAVLRILIVNHSAEKHQALIQIMQDLWKNHAFPACTLIPVSRLALQGMQIEVEATAYTA